MALESSAPDVSLVLNLKGGASGYESIEPIFGIMSLLAALTVFMVGGNAACAFTNLGSCPGARLGDTGLKTQDLLRFTGFLISLKKRLNWPLAVRS